MIERIIAASVRNRILVFVFTLFAIVAGFIRSSVRRSMPFPI